VVIATTKRKKAKPYDKLIRSFKYSAALDSVLGVCIWWTIISRFSRKSSNGRENPHPRLDIYPLGQTTRRCGRVCPA
jgi:hypothetical protein